MTSKADVQIKAMTSPDMSEVERAARKHLSIWGCNDMANQGMVNMVADAMRKGAALAAAPPPPAQWPEPKVTSPDIAEPTGIPYIDGLLHQLLDAQQDINLEANERMSQSLCDASALIDEVENVIRQLAAPPIPEPGAEQAGRTQPADQRHNEGGG